MRYKRKNDRVVLQSVSNGIDSMRPQLAAGEIHPLHRLIVYQKCGHRLCALVANVAETEIQHREVAMYQRIHLETYPLEALRRVSSNGSPRITSSIGKFSEIENFETSWNGPIIVEYRRWVHR